MIRTLNFAFIVMTGLVCLGLYRIAEEARVAAADLKATRMAIVRENDALTVLGAEWARLTQPGRIQALVGRHLELSDRPEAQLSSLTQLPSKIRCSCRKTRYVPKRWCRSHCRNPQRKRWVARRNCSPRHRPIHPLLSSTRGLKS